MRLYIKMSAPGTKFSKQELELFNKIDNIRKKVSMKETEAGHRHYVNEDPKPPKPTTEKEPDVVPDRNPGAKKTRRQKVGFMLDKLERQLRQIDTSNWDKPFPRAPCYCGWSSTPKDRFWNHFNHKGSSRLMNLTHATLEALFPDKYHPLCLPFLFPGHKFHPALAEMAVHLGGSTSSRFVGGLNTHKAGLSTPVSKDADWEKALKWLYHDNSIYHKNAAAELERLERCSARLLEQTMRSEQVDMVNKAQGEKDSMNKEIREEAFTAFTDQLKARSVLNNTLTDLFEAGQALIDKWQAEDTEKERLEDEEKQRLEEENERPREEKQRLLEEKGKNVITIEDTEEDGADEEDDKEDSPLAEAKGDQEMEMVKDSFED
jgi:hypothetical protein